MRQKKLKNIFHWTPERHRMYEQAVRELRQSISSGRTYYQAFDTLAELDLEVRAFIEEDFLKILIAEEHFGADIPIEDMALFLGLPLKHLETCRDTLVKDMNTQHSIQPETDADISH